MLSMGRVGVACVGGLLGGEGGDPDGRLCPCLRLRVFANSISKERR